MAAVLILAVLALLAVRPVTVEARTPAQVRAAARAAGWARITGRTVQVVVVVALLVLAAACRICWHTAWAAGSVVAVLAVGLAALGGGPELQEGGAA